MKKNLVVTVVLIIIVAIAVMWSSNTSTSSPKTSIPNVSTAVKNARAAKMPVVTTHFSLGQGEGECLGCTDPSRLPPPTQDGIKYLLDQIPQSDSPAPIKGVRVVSLAEMPRVIAMHVPQDQAEKMAKVVTEETEKTLDGMRRQGFIEVNAEDIAAFERSAVNGKVLEDVQNDLTFDPATGLRGELVGAEAHGSFNNEKWNMLTRTWKDRNGNLVQLEEADLSSGGALVSKEMVDQTKISVGGSPAVMVMQKNSETGKVIGEIAWYTKDKGYVLRSTNASVNKSDLAALARSIRD